MSDKIIEISEKEYKELKDGYIKYKSRLQIIWLMLSHSQVMFLIDRRKEIRDWFNNEDMPE